MAALTPLFIAAGAVDTRSFGHAGNVLFTAPRPAVGALLANARTAIAAVCGERPAIMLRTAAELAQLVEAEPFASCDAEAGDKLYVAFLARKPRLADACRPSRRPKGSRLALHGREALLVESSQTERLSASPTHSSKTSWRLGDNPQLVDGDQARETTARNNAEDFIVHWSSALLLVLVDYFIAGIAIANFATRCSPGAAC
jgi:uncharacterized protein (DUF1697 family)